jgi:hypothetical protein
LCKAVPGGIGGRFGVYEIGGSLGRNPRHALDETPHPSAAPAQYAMEINQGFFKERGITVGDTVELPL